MRSCDSESPTHCRCPSSDAATKSTRTNVLYRCEKKSVGSTSSFHPVMLEAVDASTRSVIFCPRSNSWIKMRLVEWFTLYVEFIEG
eukprot:COSAG02_NODE_1924_length_10351_cov_4.487320_6_plen_86_part_00